MNIAVYFTPNFNKRYKKDVTLITIYDKSELATISKSKINEILKQEGLL